MLERLFNLQADGSITHAALDLRSSWGGVAALIAIAAAIAAAVYLYRRESGLSKRKRVMLGVLRAALLAIVALLLLEPVLAIESAVALKKNVLVLVDTSQSMAIADQRKDAVDQFQAAVALNRASADDKPDALSTVVRSEVSQTPRLAVARGLLDHPQMRVFDRLEEAHRVGYFTFGSELTPIPDATSGDDGRLGALQADAPSTRLGVAVDEAVRRYGGQAMAGVIVLSDGASNQGMEPIEAARRLGERGIPVYTVGIGLPEPPDVAIRQVTAPETAFLRDVVPVRVQIETTGYAGQQVEVAASVGDRQVATRTVELTAGIQHVDLPFTPTDGVGETRLTVTATVLPGETSAANNTASQPLRLIDEKIKVLYVEGAPRWEYRYLRQVLLRDHRLDVRFLMTLGDRDLATQSHEFVPNFPQTDEETFEYDLIIVGDVPARYFTPAQLERIEQLVRERGGSLLLLAGPLADLGSYAGTPLDDILPVKLSGATGESLPPTVRVIVTPQGQRSAFVQIAGDNAANQTMWDLVRPLYEVPAVEDVKPGATVLATLSDNARRREPYPLIAWHRYGSGKALYVGTDQLWRMRLKRGDELHARFWGQAIQFLTLSRLLGENKRVRIEINGREFSAGQRVPIFVNVLSESYEPSRVPDYTLRVERTSPDQQTQTITLQPVTDTPGLFEGSFVPQTPGQYRVLPPVEDESIGNVAAFSVQALALEQLEPAMQRDQLVRMAQVSGGRFFRPADLAELPDLIEPEHRTTLVRREQTLWDVPVVLLVVLGLAGTEWFIRRRSNLV